jgi:seryl-tRNA synthetase
MKKRVGRPKGSKNKEECKEKVSAKASAVPESCMIRLAINQVDQANSIKNLEIAVNSLSQGINNLVQNTNKALGEVAKKIQASDSRMSDVEKAVSSGKDNGTEADSLT